MKKLLQRFLKSNNGLSIVELIVTIGIMSVITFSIGAAVVSATRNYNKGTAEVNIQASGQNITNILTNLVIDSSRAASDVDGNLSATGSNLFIKDVAGKCYAIIFKPNVNANGTGSLFYGEGADYTVASADDNLLTLADNVAGFNADTSTYNKDYTVHITIDLYFPGGDRNYRSSFSVTSRNAAAYTAYIDNLDGAVIINDSIVVIEPNQDTANNSLLTAQCRVVTSGAVTNHGIGFWLLKELKTNPTAADDINNTYGWNVTYNSAAEQFEFSAGDSVPTDANGNVYVCVYTLATRPDGNAYDIKWITVNVRRVTTVKIDKDVSASTATTTSANSLHVIQGNLGVTNGERFFVTPSDNDYISPYDVIWTASCIGKDGHDLYYYIDSILDGNGVDHKSEIFSATGYRAKSGETYKLKIKNTLPRNETITITMSAVHPEGFVDGSSDATNKATVDWGVQKTYPSTPATYIISAGGIFEDPGDYQRGDQRIENTFSDTNPASIYNVLFKSLHNKLKLSSDPQKQAASDWLDKFLLGQVNYKVGFFYSIKHNPNGLHPELSDDWSQYRIMNVNQNTSGHGDQGYNFSGVQNIGDATEVTGVTMANRLVADMNESVEWIVMLYDDTTNEILWPYYEKLMDYGFGTAHNGVNYHFGQFAKDLTEDYSTYGLTFGIRASEVDYFQSSNYFTYDFPAKAVGTVGNPLILGDNLGEGQIQYEQDDWVGLWYQAYQNNYAGEVFKWTGSGWTHQGYFGEGNAVSGKTDPITHKTIGQRFSSLDGGFTVWTSNRQFVFSTINNNDYNNNDGTAKTPPVDLDGIYKVVPMLLNYKVGYIKESDGIWSTKVYFDSDHVYNYYLTGGEGVNSAKGGIIIRRYGAKKNIPLVYEADVVCSKASIEFTEGRPISLPIPSREGYIFLGWYDNAVEGNRVNDGATSLNCSRLYARWEPLGDREYVIGRKSLSTYLQYPEGSQTTIYKYTYSITNYVETSCKMKVIITVDATAKPLTWNYNPQYTQNEGREWVFEVDLSKGVSRDITVESYYGEVVGVRAEYID